MKKAYKKPLLIVERFALTQTIAAGCSPADGLPGLVTFASVDSCGFDMSWGGGLGTGLVLFTNEHYCDLLTESFDGICYNGPNGGLNVFSS